jgi:hypothetical protein
MPLKKALRQEVIDYILRDIAPGKSPQQKPMDWFLDQFSFVDNAKLRKHLAEAFYQARLIEKIREAIGLKKDFGNVFIKTQIILYASIYEALIDYALDKNKTSPEVTALLKQEFYSPLPALSSSTEFIYKENGTSHKIYTCKKKERTQQIKEIQFNDRLKTAVLIGFVDDNQKLEIQELYTSRNKMHILSAATDDFKPDNQQSSKAFLSLFAFLGNARTFLIQS